MKSYYLLTLSLLLVAGTASAQSAREEILNQIENVRVGEKIRPADLHGHYRGTCYTAARETRESLFFDIFTNASGVTTDVPLTTLQAYDGLSLPENLSFLNQNSVEAWAGARRMINEGLSGADNNRGAVKAGEDFRYVYETRVEDLQMTMSVRRDYGCSPGVVCNPPILTACSYGYNSLGQFVYDNCVRNADQTVFKLLADGRLISHRTADGIGRPTNNMSFYLSPISTACEWQKSSN